MGKDRKSQAYYGAYKPFRNFVRQLNCIEGLDVVGAFSRHNQQSDYTLPNDIEFPYRNKNRMYGPHDWELEFIATELLISGKKNESGLSLKQWKNLYKCLKLLREIENNIYIIHDEPDTVKIELMRIAHRQFIWQKRPMNQIHLLRYYKIFSDPIIDKLFFNKFGLTVQKVYQIGFSLLSIFINKTYLENEFTSEIKQLPKELFDKFLSHYSINENSLTNHINEERLYDSRLFYAFNPLKAYPIFAVELKSGKHYCCPLPILFFWRITTGLYYDLLDQPEFLTTFGGAFQKYTGEVLEAYSDKTKMQILCEESYYVGKKRKDTTDWMLLDHSSVMFIECKTKRLSYLSKTNIDDLISLEMDLAILADGIIQMYKTILDYEKNLYPHIIFNKELSVFPALVTLEAWHFTGHPLQDKLESILRDKMEENNLPSSLLNEKPYSIFSMQEFEVATQVMSKVGIQKFVCLKQNDPDKKRWSWESYINDQFNEHVSDEVYFREDMEKLLVL